MRPSGETPPPPTIPRAAPPAAKPPRWTKCQSFGRPSCEEYWHIGDTQMRLRKVTERRDRGTKSWAMAGEHSQNGERGGDRSRVVVVRCPFSVVCNPSLPEPDGQRTARNALACVTIRHGSSRNRERPSPQEIPCSYRSSWPRRFC